MENVNESMNELYKGVAFKIAARICRDAIWDGNSCNWIGPGVIGDTSNYQIVQKNHNIDIYQGNAGIAYFLNELLLVEDDPIIVETFQGCLNQVINNLDKDPLNSNLSFFEGSLGCIWLIIQCGIDHKNDQWIELGLSKLRGISTGTQKKEQLDIMGIAGAILVLCHLYDRFKESWMIDWAQNLGHHLCSLGEQSQNQMTWKTLDPTQGLIGFGHGSAGISLALLRLYQFTRDPKFFNTSRMGYNHVFNGVNSFMINPNFTSSQSIHTQGFQSWCHGLAGILSSFLNAWSLTQEATFKEMIERCSQLVYQSTVQSLHNVQTTSFCLCHGLAGNAMILSDSSKSLGNPGYQSLSTHIAQIGIQYYSDPNIPWQGGLKDPVSGQNQSSLGLMIGDSGIGSFYLHLASRPTPLKSLLLI